MALDNAEFISELSVLDPPGTDPLNQGDDHIRTTKKAVQQSFPNVGSAVPQTGVQMAQMAIKNEANLFTQVNTFQQEPVFLDNISLNSAVNNRVKFSTSGVQAWEWLHVGASAAFELRRFVGGILVDAPIQINNAFGEATFLADTSFGKTVLVADGVEAAPAFRFTAQTNSGMFRLNSTNLGFAVAGVTKLIVGATIQANSAVRSIGGTQAAPGYAFTNEFSTGMFQDVSNRLSFGVSGNLKMIMDLTQVQVPAGTFLRALENANPSDLNDVITVNSQFTFERIIGFRDTVFMQKDMIFNDLTDARPKVAWRLNSVDHFSVGTSGIGGVSWSFTRFSDTGAFLGNPFRIFRLTGQIEMGELPTSNPGGSGILWRNGNVVNIT